MSEKLIETQKVSEVQQTVNVGEKDYLIGTLENGQTFKINAKDVALALMKFMPVADKDKNGLKDKGDFMSRGWSPNINESKLPGVYTVGPKVEGAPIESGYSRLFVIGSFPDNLIQIWRDTVNKTFIRFIVGDVLGEWIKLN